MFSSKLSRVKVSCQSLTRRPIEMNATDAVIGLQACVPFLNPLGHKSGYKFGINGSLRVTLSGQVTDSDSHENRDREAESWDHEGCDVIELIKALGFIGWDHGDDVFYHTKRRRIGVLEVRQAPLGAQGQHRRRPVLGHEAHDSPEAEQFSREKP